MTAEHTPSVTSIDKDSAGMRLDCFVATWQGMSRSGAVRLIEGGQVTVNSALADKKYITREGDSISLLLPSPTPTDTLPEDIPLDVIYEDNDLLVINKPSGMVVHPAPGNPSGTLVNALLFHCGASLSGIGGEIRPGIVHRIDKDTSGLLVVAKCDEAHAGLSAQLSDHHIRRVYYALVHGGFSADSGTVNLPIGRHPVDRKKMAVVRDGSHSAREAITHWQVLERFSGITLLKLELETGRTHQIRVHMSALGHPLLGDPVYGRTPSPFEKKYARHIDGQCLHAGALTFTHPRTNELMHFTCDLPENFRFLLDVLRHEQTT